MKIARGFAICLLILLSLTIGYFAGVFSRDSLVLETESIENEVLRVYMFPNEEAVFIQHPLTITRVDGQTWIVNEECKVTCVNNDKWNYVLIYFDREFLEKNIPKENESKLKEGY